MDRSLREAILAEMLEKSLFDLGAILQDDKDKAVESMWNTGYRLALCANAMTKGLLSGLADCDRGLLGDHDNHTSARKDGTDTEARVSDS